MYSIKHCVVPAENIHINPMEGICRMTPPFPLDFPKSAPKIYPPPPHFGFSKIFAQPLEILLLTEVKK